MRSISSQNCRRDSGSTPVVGSSRISRSGSWISAQHRPSFCFMPPESLPAGRSGEGRQAGRLQQVGDAPLALGAAVAEQAAEEVDVLEHRERRIEVPARVPAACRRCAGRPGGGAARRPCRRRAPRRCPVWMARAPGDQRQQAGLADAVRADQADHAAGRQLESDGVERAGRAVAQADVVQSSDGPSGRTDASAGAARAHCGSFTARWAGHSRSGIEPHIGHAGQSGLDLRRCAS